MIDRLALAIPAILLTGATLWLARRRSPLAPSVIAVGMTALIATFFPLTSALLPLFSWRHGVHLPDEYVLADGDRFNGLNLVGSRKFISWQGGKRVAATAS